MNKMVVGLNIAIAITILGQNNLLVIPSVAAFRVAPSRSHVFSQTILKQNPGFQQKQNANSGRFSAFPFYAERKSDDKFEIASQKPSQNDKEKELKNLYHVQNFLAGLASLALTLTIATTVIGLPLPANAGFGPSGSATTSAPPNLNSITTTAAKTTPENAPTSDFNIDLDGKKLRILIDSTLNPKRLEEFSGELDDVIDNLRDSIKSLSFGDDENESSSKPETEKAVNRAAIRQRNEEKKKDLLRAQTVRSQIEQQEQRLIKLENQPYWFNYVAAFVASIVSTLIMHPLDTIKTRMQVQKGNEEGDDGDTPWQTQRPFETIKEPVNGVSSAVTMSSATAAPPASKELVVTGDLGNILDLYQGLFGNLFKEAPPSAVYLGVYETIKYALVPKVPPELLLWVYLLAGAAGETVGSVIRAPAEAVKSLVQSGSKANALEAIQSVLGTANGRANIFRAWGSSIYRDVPFGAIQLAIFELVKASILNNPNIEFDSSTLLSEAVIGAFAGGVGAFVTNPTDVITTRIITQDIGEDSEKPLGVLEMGKKIYDEEGINAFFTGWQARTGYWAPAISIFLGVYCSVRRAGITYDLFP